MAAADSADKAFASKIIFVMCVRKISKRLIEKLIKVKMAKLIIICSSFLVSVSVRSAVSSLVKVLCVNRCV